MALYQQTSPHAPQLSPFGTPLSTPTISFREPGIVEDGHSDRESEEEPGGSEQDFSMSRHPCLRPLLAMVFLESLGLSTTAPVISFFILEDLGSSTYELGLLVSAYSMAQILGAAVFGRCSDAYGRWPIVIFSYMWASSGFMASSLAQNFEELFVARAVAGLSGGTWPICQAYLLDVVGRKERDRYCGYLAATFAMGFVIGPGLSTGLLMTGHVSRRNILFLSGVFCFVGAVIGMVFLKESLPKERRRPFFATVEAGDKSTSDTEMLNCGLVCMWLFKFFIGSAQFIIYAMYAPWLKDTFGYGDQEMGIMLTCGGVVAVYIQGIQFKDMVTRFGSHTTLALGAVFIALGLALLPITKLLLLHVCVMLCLVVGEGYVEPGAPLLIALYSLPTHLGFANGWAAAFRGVAAVGAPILGGDLYHRCQGCAFYVASCFAWVAAALVLISWRFGAESPRAPKDVDEEDRLRSAVASYGGTQGGKDRTPDHAR